MKLFNKIDLNTDHYGDLLRILRYEKIIDPIFTHWRCFVRSSLKPYCQKQKAASFAIECHEEDNHMLCWGPIVPSLLLQMYLNSFYSSLIRLKEHYVKNVLFWIHTVLVKIFYCQQFLIMSKRPFKIFSK